jgi:hypothetical protein
LHIHRRRNPNIQGQGRFWGSGFLLPNAYVSLYCMFILLFRKGKQCKFKPNNWSRYESALTKKELDEWFSQICALKGYGKPLANWNADAPYSEEIAECLIRIFSVKGETVLDQYLAQEQPQKSPCKMNATTSNMIRLKLVTCYKQKKANGRAKGPL